MMNFKPIFLLLFSNMDILLGICFSKIKLCLVGHKVPLERNVSQIIDLGLSCYFMYNKKINLKRYIFLNFFFLDCTKKKIRT